MVQQITATAQSQSVTTLGMILRSVPIELLMKSKLARVTASHIRYDF